ncbi:MAG: hypothetical protein JWP61_94 [Friedmanniella sp.]|nr:hypothetical protein [Friedmanniella sp.]
MSAVDEILQSIPLDQLAGQLGVDPATAESATRSALPALLGGLQANAQDPAGAASLATALGQHNGDLVEGGVNLDQVNTGDGQKIVDNVFGASTPQVVQTLGNVSGGQSALMQKLLPLLAPIVMSYLAKRFAGAGGGALGSVLGDALGGAGGAGTGAGGLGGLLGGLLGGHLGGSGESPTTGAQSQSEAGSVLDVLGGLLGGGRR